jgi:hypothetical protein
MVRRGILVASITVALATATAIVSVASAQPKPPVPELVGATEVVKLTGSDGFIDDGIAYDDQRIAYVVTDGTTKAELHLVAVSTEQDTPIDISAITMHAVSLRLLGNRAFVVGQAEDGSQTGTLIELAPAAKKPVVYKLGSATRVTPIMRDGKLRVVVERDSQPSDGITRHEATLYAIETGARLGGGHLDVDAQGYNKQLDFHVNHWADGMSRAFGIKGGEWDPKEDTRSPNAEAGYDLIAGKIVDRTPIADLFEQRKRYQALADAGGVLDFVRMAWDNQSVQIWRAGKAKPVELDQPLVQYDPKSLQGELQPDGSAWIALKVDPVNPDAVARKKADPEYLDVFRVGADNKAVRVARVLSTGTRRELGAMHDRFWLLERSNGFDRGGKSLTVYKPAS